MRKCLATKELRVFKTFLNFPILSHSFRIFPYLSQSFRIFPNRSELFRFVPLCSLPARRSSTLPSALRLRLEERLRPEGQAGVWFRADKSSFAIVGRFYHYEATVKNFFKRVISAFLLLTSSTESLAGTDPRRFERLAGAMMLLSIAIGAVLAGLWDLTSHVTCVVWPHLLNYWVVSSLVCGLVIVFGPYRRSAASLIESAVGVGRLSRWVGPALLAAVVAVVLNYAFRQSNPDWPTQLSLQLAWLWPRPLCRVLLLMPVWGAWSMVVLVQFHRPDDRTDPPARCFAETVGPLSSAVCLAVPLAGSLMLLNFLYPWRHFIPPAAAVATALGAGTLIVRRRGRMSRKALLATNFLTQLGFLTAYLVVR